MIVKIIVTPCVDFMARPSSKPVNILKSFAFKINLSPSIKFLSPGPMMNLINPPVKNITPIENALEKVEQLRGVTFDWKDDVEEKGFIPYAKHETGVIAQDVQKVIPDAAVPAPFEENYLTVKHEKIIPLLIEAIKELKAEVESLKK